MYEITVSEKRDDWDKMLTWRDDIKYSWRNIFRPMLSVVKKKKLYTTGLVWVLCDFFYRKTFTFYPKSYRELDAELILGLMKVFQKHLHDQRSLA